MVFISAEIEISGSETILINNANSKSLNTEITDRADYDKPSWGIISNKASISAIDINEYFKAFVEEGKLTNGKICKIYLENDLYGAKQIIATKYVSDWKYNGLTNNLSIEAIDDLEEWQKIHFEGVNYVPTVSVATSFQTIYNKLYGATPSKYRLRPFSRLEKKTQDVLRKTYVLYYTMNADNLWSSWNKLCQCCGLYIYKNEYGETIVSADYSIYGLPEGEVPEISEEEKITLDAPIIELYLEGEPIPETVKLTIEDNNGHTFEYWAHKDETFADFVVSVRNTNLAFSIVEGAVHFKGDPLYKNANGTSAVTPTDIANGSYYINVGIETVALKIVNAITNSTMEFVSVPNMTFDEFVATSYNTDNAFSLSEENEQGLKYVLYRGAYVYSSSGLNEKVMNINIASGVYYYAQSLSKPILSLDGDILTITDESGLAERFDIMVDGEVKETIEFA